MFSRCLDWNVNINILFFTRRIFIFHPPADMGQKSMAHTHPRTRRARVFVHINKHIHTHIICRVSI